ncbi:MAG TPA: hypothetical protein PKC28_14555, partial [Bdellovibrionales bacterium]|nr:hypothetical protein [Bdellovibrionales bacterium]
DKAATPEPAPAPKVCTRSLMADTAYVGRVQSANCRSLGVGVQNNQVTVTRFNEDGSVDSSFADAGTYRPFEFRFAGYDIKPERVAVVGDGFLVMGTYQRFGGGSEFFAFHLLDDGYLNALFGPLRDGVIRNRIGVDRVTAISSPTVQGDNVAVRVNYESGTTGLAFDRLLIFPSSGRQAFAKNAPLVAPVTCEVVVHDGFSDGVRMSFRQTVCATVPMDGTSIESAWIGEMQWFHEGTFPIAITRDGLGRMRRDYVTPIEGVSQLCGQSVSPSRRYLVFSEKRLTDADWQLNCWFM